MQDAKTIGLKFLPTLRKRSLIASVNENIDIKSLVPRDPEKILS